MEDFQRPRHAASETDQRANQVALQRLVKGFRREEEENNRRHLLYGDEHLERPAEKIPRGD